MFVFLNRMITFPHKQIALALALKERIYPKGGKTLCVDCLTDCVSFPALGNGHAGLVCLLALPVLNESSLRKGFKCLF